MELAALAMDLERWVIRHFYCQELKIALRRWDQYLALASPSTEHLYKISPPAVLLPILPEIEELLDGMRSLDIHIEINQVAPPRPYEESEYDRVEICPEAGMLVQAVKQGMAVKALRIVASNLNEQQRLEVVRWAQLHGRTKISRMYTLGRNYGRFVS